MYDWFSWRRGLEMGHEIISTAILSLALIVSYWRKDVHIILVNCLGLSLSRKSVI